MQTLIKSFQKYLNSYYTQLVKHYHFNKNEANKQLIQYIDENNQYINTSGHGYSLLRSFCCDFDTYQLVDFNVVKHTEYTFINHISIFYTLNGLKKSKLNSLLNSLNLSAVTYISYNKKTYDLFIHILCKFFQDNNIDKKLLIDMASLINQKFYSEIFIYQFKNDLIQDYYLFITNNFDQLPLYISFLNQKISQIEESLNKHLSNFTKKDLNNLAILNTTLKRPLQLDTLKLISILDSKNIKNDWQFLNAIADKLPLPDLARTALWDKIYKAEARYVLNHMVK